jgi:N-acetylmuramoyl-L-alanine amidase
MEILNRAGRWVRSASSNAKDSEKEELKSKYLYILDSGHGGLDPSTGKYVTSGKRSPKFNDGSVLYEGVENRRKVKAIMLAMKDAGLECIDIVDTWKDISLGERVNRANKLVEKRKCIYISIHSDAYGKGWTSPSGIGVYQFTNSQMSAPIAKIFRKNITNHFDGLALDRGIKNASFYVLRWTNCPAVLIEYGFHTNKDEAKKMITDRWITMVSMSVVESCLEIENM